MKAKKPSVRTLQKMLKCAELQVKLKASSVENLEKRVRELQDKSAQQYSQFAEKQTALSYSHSSALAAVQQAHQFAMSQQQVMVGDLSRKAQEQANEIRKLKAALAALVNN